MNLISIVASLLLLNNSGKDISFRQADSIPVYQSEEIQIGQQVPDFKLHHVFNYKDSVLQLSDFRGKAVIIDFWATFCIPCVKMLPEMARLQRANDKDLQVISVAYQNTEKVKSFLGHLAKYNINFPVATEDDHILDNGLLLKFFPHEEVPHYIWIDKKGILRAITGHEEISDSNILKLISGVSLNIGTTPGHSVASDTVGAGKKTIIFGRTLINGLHNDSKGDFTGGIKYNSCLSGYDHTKLNQYGIFGNPAFRNRRISAMNCSPFVLYSVAFGSDTGSFLSALAPSRMSVEISDPEKKYLFEKHVTDTLRWYCYDLILPSTDRQKLLRFMQMDLNRYFGIAATIEQRKTEVYALVIKDRTKIKTSGGKSLATSSILWVNIKNKPLSALISILQQFNEKSSLNGPIIVDETHYAGNIDIDISAPLNDMNLLRAELQKNGLDLVQRKKTIPILVLRDAE